MTQSPADNNQNAGVGATAFDDEGMLGVGSAGERLRQRTAGMDLYGSLFASLRADRSASDTMTLAEQIAERIGRSIILDQIKPGERILEQKFSEYFSVSRGPLREALRILDKEGLVEFQPRRGARVTDLTVSQVNDIFAIRASLLELAVRLTMQRLVEKSLGDEDLKRLRQAANELHLLASLENGIDEYTVGGVNMALMLTDLSGNKLLKAMIFSLAKQTLRYTRLGLASCELRLDSARRWTDLVDQIELGHQEAAREAARNLMLASRDRAARSLVKRHE